MTKNQDFYITTNSQLAQLIALIKEAKIVALDTEFTRQTTYYPILSIIQAGVKNSAGEKKTFIIDCVSDINLSEFFAIISDPEIKKILHSSTQDLQIFYKKSNLLPQGIIDSQVLANFCGFGFNVGYSNLVEKLFSKQLDKKQQRSDWQKRPLSSKQIEYALLDVVFLQEIYEQFFEILKSQNRVEWYYEEMKNFVNKALFKSDDSLSKNFSFRNKNPKQIAQIKSLISWREAWARKIDVPRQHFCKDEVIEKIVTSGLLEKTPKFTEEMLLQINKILDENLEALEKNKKVFMSDRQKNCFEEAKKLIAKISAREKFQEQFLITSLDLKKVICEKNIFDEIVSGWRYELFGKELRNLISNF